MMRTTMSSYDEQFASEGKMNYYKNKKKTGDTACTCKSKKKITIAIYNGEIHVMGKPSNLEIITLNLDKELDGIDDEPTTIDEV